MLIMLCLVWVFSLSTLKEDLGKAKNKAKFSELFSKSKAINVLSAARLFLSVQGMSGLLLLCLYLAATFDWDHWWVGGFMACWVIGYGIVQSFAPAFTGKNQVILLVAVVHFCGPAI
eukprot:TRINITY_DN14368_c0_g1_i1.p1 TRINITY_DN14368_c0_g1~~TRINITY_DN14368_c0_g1_i1.p1  ORF type:complete len:117 (-),score=1.46 TRINITY_DN14368_c0_g1_i1:84-434(-)